MKIILLVCIDLLVMITKLITKKTKRELMKERIMAMLLKMNMTGKQILEYEHAINEFSYKELEEYMRILEDQQDLETS